MRYERPQPFEELDHTADAGVVVHGATAEETLARLVLAFAELVTGGVGAEAAGTITIAVEAADRALMAVDLLRELLYRFETDAMVPNAVEVLRFDPETGAELAISTGRYDPVLHADGLVLKAITLHESRFERDPRGWSACVVFDV